MQITWKKQDATESIKYWCQILLNVITDEYDDFRFWRHCVRSSWILLFDGGSSKEEFDQADDDAPIDKEEVVFRPFVADEVEEEITKPEIVANDEDVEAVVPEFTEDRGLEIADGGGNGGAEVSVDEVLEIIDGGADGGAEVSVDEVLEIADGGGDDADDRSSKEEFDMAEEDEVNEVNRGGHGGPEALDNLDRGPELFV